MIVYSRHFPSKVTSDKWGQEQHEKQREMPLQDDHVQLCIERQTLSELEFCDELCWSVAQDQKRTAERDAVRRGDVLRRGDALRRGLI